MKGLLILLLSVSSAYFADQNSKSQEQVRVLESQVNKLEGRNRELERQNHREDAALKAQTAQMSERLKALHAKLDQENGKLQSLIDHRNTLQDALQDPSRANSNKNNESQIADKKAMIEGLEAQIKANEDSLKNLEQSGTQAQELEKINHQGNLADLNDRIHNQELAIASTEDSMKERKKSLDLYRNQDIQNLKTTLDQQRADLDELKRSRNRVNQSASIDHLEIQKQVAVEKNRIKTSEQELRAQINQIRADLKQLESLKGSSQASLNSIKQQIADSDVQIKAQRTVVGDLQELIRKEAE